MANAVWRALSAPNPLQSILHHQLAILMYPVALLSEWLITRPKEQALTGSILKLLQKERQEDAIYLESVLR